MVRAGDPNPLPPWLESVPFGSGIGREHVRFGRLLPGLFQARGNIAVYLGREPAVAYGSSRT